MIDTTQVYLFHFINKANNASSKPNFHKCNYDKLKAQIGAIDWCELLNNVDTDAALECFLSATRKDNFIIYPI